MVALRRTVRAMPSTPSPDDLAVKAEAEATQAEADAKAAMAAATGNPAGGSGGTSILVLTEPFWIDAFESGVQGWSAIESQGTVGPSDTADTVIAAAAAEGITIERR